MKILTVFPLFRQANAQITYTGGRKRVIEICKRWKKKGHHISLLTSTYGKKLCTKFGLSGTFHSYSPPFLLGVGNLYPLPPMLRRMHLLPRLLKTVKVVLEQIPHQEFDFILCPFVDSPISLLLSAFLKKKLGAPLVGFIPLIGSGVKIWGDFLQRFDLLFPNSNYYKEYLEKIGFNPERVSKGVGAAIDYEFIQSISSGKKRFEGAFLGGLIPRKGIFDLLRVWKKVCEEKPRARLVIIGRGSPQILRKIKNMMHEYHLRENILIKGFVPEKEKYKLLKQSKLFIFPSYNEATPQVVLEAMACKLPVVAYDLPVYEEWYDEELFTAKKGSEDHLASIVSSLLETPKLRAEKGKRGMEKARQYSWDQIATYEMEYIKTQLMERT